MSATVTNSADSAGLLDDKGVAALLVCSPRHVRRLVDSGRFPRAIYFGRSKRWRRATVLSFIDAAEQAGHSLTLEEFERIISLRELESQT